MKQLLLFNLSQLPRRVVIIFMSTITKIHLHKGNECRYVCLPSKCDSLFGRFVLYIATISESSISCPMSRLNSLESNCPPIIPVIRVPLYLDSSRFDAVISFTWMFHSYWSLKWKEVVLVALQRHLDLSFDHEYRRGCSDRQNVKPISIVKWAFFHSSSPWSVTNSNGYPICLHEEAFGIRSTSSIHRSTGGDHRWHSTECWISAGVRSSKSRRCRHSRTRKNSLNIGWEGCVILSGLIVVVLSLFRRSTPFDSKQNNEASIMLKEVGRETLIHSSLIKQHVFERKQRKDGYGRASLTLGQVGSLRRTIRETIVSSSRSNTRSNKTMPLISMKITFRISKRILSKRLHPRKQSISIGLDSSVFFPLGDTMIVCSFDA